MGKSARGGTPHQGAEATKWSRSTTSFPDTILRVELGVMRRPFLRVASFSRRLAALSSLLLFLPIANSMEAFVALIGRSSRRGRSSLISSSRSAKHLVTDSCNYLKADIIKANKCLNLGMGA